MRMSHSFQLILRYTLLKTLAVTCASARASATRGRHSVCHSSLPVLNSSRVEFLRFFRLKTASLNNSTNILSFM